MRFLVAGAAVVVTTAALLLGGLSARDVPRGPAPGHVSSGQLAAGFAAGDTQALVLRLQDRLRARPSNVRGLDLLGLAYQQRARETGDPSYYTKSEGVLRRALRLAPRDLDATSGLASLELSRHRFARALDLGRTALRISPSTARNHGVVGDALLELGRYRAAFRQFDTMVRLKPGVSSYARVAYARELLGRLDGARDALLLARDAAADEPEPFAWTETQLGKLELGRGRLAVAAQHLRSALRAFPGYVYALDALAQVGVARGDLEPATALERRAVETIPLPQFVGLYGDLLDVSDRGRAARLQYATEEGIRRLLRANGVRTDLETALFDVDHGIRLRASLTLARAAQRSRPSIDGDDVLAWALTRNGRCAEALRYSTLALRLGTRDAAKFFHRAEIERCLGSDPRPWARRARALNPRFSVLWAPTLRRLAS
ncbi:MAG: tetratricopeptide repeat protein [Thermoleophilia bacterium]|nr:tetratricopeptide repeat protein [Thermoleophilia bacterium]